MDREISDLQSEFENERTDYLETIRRQQRQIQLFNQILEKISPTLRKECNYRSVWRRAQCLGMRLRFRETFQKEWKWTAFYFPMS